ncbi:MAG: hypothetical protein AAF447_09400 [Myxococcota bacterium]
MRIGEPIDPRLSFVRRLHDLDDARAIGASGPRLRELRRGGARLGDALRDGPRVKAVRTLPLTTLVYPAAFAFNHALRVPVPYVQLTHRCLLVQVEAAGETKNVLFNPSDYEANKATPFFRDLLAAVPAPALAERILSTQFGQVDAQLRALGLTPEDIDVVAFDHFHTQDLRPLLGSTVPRPDGSYYQARFPNALLVAPREGWEDWADVHPLQRAWFIEEGNEGVPADRVVLTEGDLWLGEGCLLLRTPGHTRGNQTLFAHGARGVFGCSENGCSADNWSPHDSALPGLRAFARRYGLDVVLNSNTPELAADQYSSMILEREIVDRDPDDPAFVQMFPSSEVTPSLLAPGVRPSRVFGERDSGELTMERAAAPRSAPRMHA